MSKISFNKSFTQQEAIPEDAIAAAVDVMRAGRLHRYNTAPGATAPTALLESEYAAYQGVDYCLATASGGAAMQIALRAHGVKPGGRVLTNAFTLAPVPGAIAAVGAEPVFVETNAGLTIDLDDLRTKLQSSSASILMLSHMRGHIAPMEDLCELLEAAGATLIEDCAHTMGATWNGRRSGNFGVAACFSTQTYKHMNSGEGGFLTTNDADIMARATILSGSYMLYDRHQARPDMEAYVQAKLEMPNCSSRMDNLRASILRPQLKNLDENVTRWNARYHAMARAVDKAELISIPARSKSEYFVGSSFQFMIPAWPDAKCRQFVARCAERGVELKWFGDPVPAGFTSRYDSWTYAQPQRLDRTIAILGRLMDIRIPLSFSIDDCTLIGTIIAEEIGAMD